jgi:hypothetical protein
MGGMKNPTIRTARKSLEAAGIEFIYLECDSDTAL